MGHRKIIITPGQKFGRLTVIGETRRPIPSRPAGKRAALCRCDCGNVVTVEVHCLANGDTPSCGCKHRDNGRKAAAAWNVPGGPREKRSTTHGLSRHPQYHTYWNMMERCYNPERKDYPRYGGRGIRVCDAWHDLTAFIGWIDANLGPRPEGHSLDRIDNNGNYEPGNVRWATYSEQAFNRRRR